MNTLVFESLEPRLLLAADLAPVVTAANLTLPHGQSLVAAASLFSFSDPDGDTIKTYEFWDSTGSGHFTVNGAPQTAGHAIDVSAANAAQVPFWSNGCPALVRVSCWQERQRCWCAG